MEKKPTLRVMRLKHEEVVPYNLSESSETYNLWKVVEDVFHLKDLVKVFFFFFKGIRGVTVPGVCKPVNIC